MRFNCKRVNLGIVVLVLILVGLFCVQYVSAENNAQLKEYIDTVQQSKEGMTLWQMIKAGGVVMIVLLFLSLGTIAIIIYNFMTINEKMLIPTDFVDGLIRDFEAGDEVYVQRRCETSENMIAKVVNAGLSKKEKGIIPVREAMEKAAQNEIVGLWQNISYLADIASIAPLIGLLGTVLGMIQAFNVIAFQSAVVKPMLLAGGVSKAMVTTAGGLIIAIPTMFFYSYFRGKVQGISNTIENCTADVIKLIEDSMQTTIRDKKLS